MVIKLFFNKINEHSFNFFTTLSELLINTHFFKKGINSGAKRCSASRLDVYLIFSISN